MNGLLVAIAALLMVLLSSFTESDARSLGDRPPGASGSGYTALDCRGTPDNETLIRRCGTTPCKPRLSRHCLPRMPWNPSPEKPRLVTPTKVTKVPSSACTDPTGVEAVKLCVEWTLRDEGLDYLWDSGWAQTVVWCESRWIPSVISPGGYLGLWQISPKWYNGEYASLAGPWYDAEANTRAAAYIYRVQGIRAWSCSP